MSAADRPIRLSTAAAVLAVAGLPPASWDATNSYSGSSEPPPTAHWSRMRSRTRHKPLSERRLATMFGKTSRRWARSRMAEARQMHEEPLVGEPPVERQHREARSARRRTIRPAPWRSSRRSPGARKIGLWQRSPMARPMRTATGSAFYGSPPACSLARCYEWSFFKHFMRFSLIDIKLAYQA
jgi:hypothetical protein